MRNRIEILSETSGLSEIDKDVILQRAAEIQWIPPVRILPTEELTESVEWDWVFSRQRISQRPSRHGTVTSVDAFSCVRRWLL